MRVRSCLTCGRVQEGGREDGQKGSVKRDWGKRVSEKHLSLQPGDPGDRTSALWLSSYTYENVCDRVTWPDGSMFCLPKLWYLLHLCVCVFYLHTMPYTCLHTHTFTHRELTEIYTFSSNTLHSYFESCGWEMTPCFFSFFPLSRFRIKNIWKELYHFDIIQTTH